MIVHKVWVWYNVEYFRASRSWISLFGAMILDICHAHGQQASVNFNEFVKNSYSRKFIPAKYKHYVVFLVHTLVLRYSNM